MLTIKYETSFKRHDQINNSELILYLTRTGTHSDLF